MSHQVSEVSQKLGWDGQLILSTQSVEEIQFWLDNIDRLNGFRMRGVDKVNYDGLRQMFSDVGGFQIGGSEFIDEEVEVPGKRFQEALTAVEIKESSTFLEL